MKGLNAGETPLDQLAIQAGIVPVYRDLAGNDRVTSPDTKRALLRACGWQVDNSSNVKDALDHVRAENRRRILPEDIVVESGRSVSFAIPTSAHWSIIAEDSHEPVAEGRAGEVIEIPALHLGIYQLILQKNGSTETTWLLSAPNLAPSISQITGEEKLWGTNLALYGLHSKRSPGLGDFKVLADTTIALASNGSDFCGINPVHAIGWASSDVISPYSPSHRGYLNTNHLALDMIRPCSQATRTMIATMKNQLSNPSNGLVDYHTCLRLQRPILEALYKDFVELATADQLDELKDYIQKEGTTLQKFIQFEALTAQLGTDWRKWPDGPQSQYNGPQSEHQQFHAWLQMHAEAQLRLAQETSKSKGMSLGLYLDLAVGSRRDGAEAWSEQDSMAKDVSIGAPPDHLSPAGQNWNLSAMAPHKLARNGYRAFRDIIARNMRHCGVLRIDHILGLNRSFWIPDDGTPGGYIKQNFDSLLAVIRMEASRNQTIVIGEDLGLVPDGFRRALKRSGIYSYTVMQYEKDKSGNFRGPLGFDPQTLACFGTHDTPTLQGFVQGSDIDWWQKLNWISEKSAIEAKTERKAEIGQLSKLKPKHVVEQDSTKIASLSPVCAEVYTALAASPVAMVSVQLDDIEGKTNAQNLPGTIDEHPNWKQRSSMSVEELQTHPGLQEMGQIMARNNRGKRKTD